MADFENRYFKLKAEYTRHVSERQAAALSDEPLHNSTVVTRDAFQKLVDQQTTFLERLSSTSVGSSETNAIQRLAETLSQSTSNRQEVRLPHLQMTSFDGQYDKFKPFWDIFDTTVHKNERLSKVQKFQYLKGLLKGEPEEMIKHLAVTETNYEEALGKLKERYDKPSQVIESLVKTFFDIKRIDSSNATLLRSVVNTFDQVIRGLRALGPRAERRDPWLIALILKKVDSDTHKAWAEHVVEKAYPTIEDLTKFLNLRCDALEIGPSTPSVKTTGAAAPIKYKSTRAYLSAIDNACPKCLDHHHLSYCPKYIVLDTAKRREFVNTKRLCFNCLKARHTANKCPSKHSCEQCHLRHHSSLHVTYKPSASSTASAHAGTSTPPTSNNLEKPKTPEDKAIPTTAESSALISNQNYNLLSHGSEASNQLIKFNALLPTAMVFVADYQGNLQRCNILLDSGCQNTLITSACAERLGLPRHPANVKILGLSASKVGVSKGRTNLKIYSHFNKKLCLDISALVFGNITSDQPSVPIQIKTWDKLNCLDLADPHFNEPKKIDILLEADYFFSILCKEQVIQDKVVVAQNTLFGWVICGPHLADSEVQCNISTQENDLNKTLQMFWKTEELPTRTIPPTKDEQKAEEIYQNTVQRNEAGRYSVRLPFNSQGQALGHSYTSAENRLFAMERKFARNNKLRDDYRHFMSEYLALGHMELISGAEINRENTKLYYLPHHAVFKDKSLTTKLRVVFDGSCKSSSGKSLNEILLPGPPLQQDLTTVILRYRCFEYCFSADIKQMFRMIEVQQCDRDFQRILWRDSPDQPIQHYRLTTVTYGTSPAPFLSIRTLQQLSLDEGHRFPLASKALIENFYVDDCMAGANTINEARELASQLDHMLTAGGFSLRKWASNRPEIISNIPIENRVSSVVEVPNEFNICLLGISWNPVTDCFLFDVSQKNPDLTTKRKLLSEISKIFDPLGWVSPTIIMAKIILQKLWLLKIGWDDRLPNEIIEESTKFHTQLHLLNQINIPRILFTQENKVQFHGFCDASSAAYSAVIYCRRILSDGSASVNIVMAKTKVAPLKEVSIPRLELCGAHLLAGLFEFLKTSIRIKDDSIYCWTDSKIVLAWLSSHPRKWKTYVSNRTSYILDSIPQARWLHVISGDNPADCASRGITPSVLIQHNLWWKGLSWLSLSQNHWPDTEAATYSTQEEERSREQMILQVTTKVVGTISDLNGKLSKWIRLYRVLAYCFRFYLNLKNKKNDKSPLKVTELQHAKNILYKFSQEESLSDDIKNLRNNNYVQANSKLKRLAPYIDDSGVLRVGGRLDYLETDFDCKHQVILHKDHSLTRKIVTDCHTDNHHIGVTTLIATLRQSYWIVGLRDLAKSVVHRCTICHRHSKQTSSQLMGNIPKYRLHGIYPFYDTGCDYAGPFLLRQHNGRRAPIIKSYIALFICLTTKALHLELVSDLSTDCFLAALKRFVARRGLCAHIRSDNGTNFVGAARQLGELHRLFASHNNHILISDFLSSKGIQWHFIPPGTPHFGGAWESGVKRVKFHLRRVIGQSTLNFEEMTTLLTQVEAILNSRPLCALSDSDDTSYLTPGHFLTGRPLVAIPEPDVTNVKMSLLARWKLVQQLTQGFWSKWSSEYISSLQPRQKWNKAEPNIKIGDIVLLKDENLPPAYWKIGKVTATHAGGDGLVRVATVRTKTGLFKRPVTKISILPLDD
ncbi:uncharacterized protein LOC129938987 [Eupeodes corollae]|uniref:uncharacterized protein LOC129938987 n=1 Tax=Eupeodes corollae TaxID=290404 RepID=UPI002493C587|nr:uncharacterized protein LOC129938987 [Eupeodes corollae]